MPRAVGAQARLHRLGLARECCAFLAVEDDLDFGGDDRHGKGGPIPLQRIPFEQLPPLDRALRAAIAELGYPDCDDYHTPTRQE